MTHESDPAEAVAERGPIGQVATPATDGTFLDVEIDERDAVGYVAVGGGLDADLRYLTRFRGPEDRYAYVHTGGERVLCPPADCVARARRQFDGRIATARPADHPGERAAAVLDSAREADPASDDRAPTVLVPPTIPHDAAIYLERAGYELRSTTAVGEARTTKTDAEIEAIQSVQRAAERGVRRGERILAAAESGAADELLWKGRPLTAERLRREVNAELARGGVSDAGNTSVAVGSTVVTGATGVAGSSDVSEAITGNAPRADGVAHRDESVVVDVAPRGPSGYHGRLSRTFVVDSDGGWERRAYVASEAALDAALGEIEPGAAVADVGREATAELAAFGFGPTSGGNTDSDSDPTEIVHGVGLSRRERPRAQSGATLESGGILAVSPSVTDGDHGQVRLSELIVVTDEGYERIGGGERAFTPRE
ncbi:M24 family metallopeptidase [Halobellus captivus]|uniref:M24 family metallopeptidase n=1 Tax=Halobellus captivus TaxID=2592614 RepID=UPI00119EB734|nr:M24 family metallopeptidase [Halobellus captivus]